MIGSTCGALRLSWAAPPDAALLQPPPWRFLILRVKLAPSLAQRLGPQSNSQSHRLPERPLRADEAGEVDGHSIWSALDALTDDELTAMVVDLDTQASHQAIAGSGVADSGVAATMSIVAAAASTAATTADDPPAASSLRITARPYSSSGLPSEVTLSSLAHKTTYLVWVAAQLTDGAIGPWAAVAAEIGDATLPPEQPAPPTFDDVHMSDCTTLVLRLPAPREGCAGPDEYELQWLPPGEAVWAVLAPSLAAGAAPAAPAAITSADAGQHVSLHAARLMDGVELRSSWLRGRWHLHVSGVRRHAQHEFRLIARNRHGASVPSASSGALVAAISATAFRAPPLVRATSSASFAVQWAAGGEYLSECLAGLAWEVLYRDGDERSGGGSGGSGGSGGGSGLSGAGGLGAGLVQSSSQLGGSGSAGGGAWHVLGSSVPTRTMSVEPLRCPRGCSFKVRATSVRLAASSPEPPESMPSATVSSPPLPPMPRGATRVELTVGGDRAWSEVGFSEDVAAMLGLYAEQVRVVEARPAGNTFDARLAEAEAADAARAYDEYAYGDEQVNRQVTVADVRASGGGGSGASRRVVLDFVSTASIGAVEPSNIGRPTVSVQSTAMRLVGMMQTNASWHAATHVRSGDGDEAVLEHASRIERWQGVLLFPPPVPGGSSSSRGGSALHGFAFGSSRPELSLPHKLHWIAPPAPPALPPPGKAAIQAAKLIAFGHSVRAELGEHATKLGGHLEAGESIIEQSVEEASRVRPLRASRPTPRAPTATFCPMQSRAPSSSLPRLPRARLPAACGASVPRQRPCTDASASRARAAGEPTARARAAASGRCGLGRRGGAPHAGLAWLLRVPRRARTLLVALRVLLRPQRRSGRRRARAARAHAARARPAGALRAAARIQPLRERPARIQPLRSRLRSGGLLWRPAADGGLRRLAAGGDARLLTHTHDHESLSDLGERHIRRTL